MNPEIIMTNLGLVLEIVLAFTVIQTRLYKLFPFFSLYILESAITNPVISYMYVHMTSSQYTALFQVVFVLDSLLQFIVIAEVSLVTFRPFLKLLPRYATTLLILVFFLLMLLLSAVIFNPSEKNIYSFALYFFFIRNTIAISRAAFFISIIAFSRILAISWRNRHMQIATGFGIYAIAYLMIVFAHTYQTSDKNYHLLDQTSVVVYLAVLLYWLLSFSRPLPDTKKFTPEMRDSLLRLAHQIRKNESLVTGDEITPGQESNQTKENS